MNRFKLRNFDCHHEQFSYACCDDDSEALAFSNSVYDVSKGITHSFVKVPLDDEHVFVRLVSDVELAFSTDPSVTAICPPMVQNALRQRILNMPRGPVVPATDDELLDSVPSTFGLETSDAVKVASAVSDRFPSPSPISPDASSAPAAPQSASPQPAE